MGFSFISLTVPHYLSAPFLLPTHRLLPCFVPSFHLVLSPFSLDYDPGFLPFLISPFLPIRSIYFACIIHSNTKQSITFKLSIKYILFYNFTESTNCSLDNMHCSRDTSSGFDAVCQVLRGKVTFSLELPGCQRIRPSPQISPLVCVTSKVSLRYGPFFVTY